MTTRTLNLFKHSESLFRIFGIIFLSIVLMTACSDDDDEKKTPVSLSPSTLSLLTDEQKEVTISGGEAPYSVKSNSNQAVATAEVDGSTIIVTGITEGTTDVIVSGTDGSSAVLSVSVSQKAAELITFDQLKANLTSGESVTLPNAIKIKGVVISDSEGKNIDAKTAIFQEDNDKGGIIVNFAANHSLKAGDEAEIQVSKLTLAKVNGELTIKDVPLGNITPLAAKAITPRQTTVAEILTNAAAWNGTLVTLGEGNFAGGNDTYKGTIDYVDASGSIASLVLDGAEFAGKAYPLFTSSFTGIVRADGENVRVDIRKSIEVISKDGYFYTDDFSKHDVGFYDNNLNRRIPFLGNTEVEPFYYMVTDNKMFSLFTMTEEDSDASFSTLGRNYLRIFQYDVDQLGDWGTSLYLTGQVVEGGMKSITVIFATSKAGVADYAQLTAPENFMKNMQFDEFSADKNKYTVGFYTGEYGGTYMQEETEPITDQGVWHRVTFKIPEKFTPPNGDDDRNVTNIEIRFMNFGIRGNVDVKRNYQWGNKNFNTPIIIDKVIIECEKDAYPDWK